MIKFSFHGSEIEEIRTYFKVQMANLPFIMMIRQQKPHEKCLQAIRVRVPTDIKSKM